MRPAGITETRPRAARTPRLLPRWDGDNFGLTPLQEAVLIAGGHLPPRPFALGEIAEIFGVTTQAIHHTMDVALGKLARHQELGEYMYDSD